MNILTELDDLRYCNDCAALIANGELPDGNDDFALLDEWDGWHLYLNCDIHEFVKSPCDGCGSKLHGSRHTGGAFEIGEQK